MYLQGATESSVGLAAHRCRAGSALHGYVTYSTHAVLFQGLTYCKLFEFANELVYVCDGIHVVYVVLRPPSKLSTLCFVPHLYLLSDRLGVYSLTTFHLLQSVLMRTRDE